MRTKRTTRHMKREQRGRKKRTYRKYSDSLRRQTLSVKLTQKQVQGIERSGRDSDDEDVNPTSSSLTERMTMEEVDGDFYINIIINIEVVFNNWN